MCFTGRGQNINIKKNLEDIDSNPHGWVWGVQDFSGGSNWRCGKNSTELKLEVETWRCDWIVAIS